MNSALTTVMSRSLGRMPVLWWMWLSSIRNVSR